jgi:hypothetical protein
MADIFEAGEEDDLQIVNETSKPTKSIKNEVRSMIPPLDLPDECEIILVVDNREKRNNQDINYFYDRFKASGIKTELKSLPLGDFIWILRMKNNQDVLYEEPDANELAEINNPDPDLLDENNGKKKTK